MVLANSKELRKRGQTNFPFPCFGFLTPRAYPQASSPREPPFVSSARFWYVVCTRTLFYQNRQSLLPAGQKYKSTSKSISCQLQLSRGGGEGGALKGVLGRGQCQGLQTRTLLKTKNAHLATLFKTRLSSIFP